MRKTWKKLMTFALAGTMAIGMSTTAFAANSVTDSASKYTNSGDTVASDTATINLIKDYVRGKGTATDSSSPAENFVFTITPYGVWNAGSSTGEANGEAYTTGNMPALATASTNVTVAENDSQKNVVTVTGATAGANSKANTTITLSEFKSVGDFWYKVEETNSKTTGVFYGTNDSKENNTTAKNGGHDAIYYIHVQVVNNTSGQTPKFLRSVTLHKEAPGAAISNTEYNTWSDENYKAGKKVNDVQNTYYAGELSVKKEVTGNAGDKDKRFEVTVTFTKPAGTIITSDITYSAAGSATETTQSSKTINNQKDNASDWKTAADGTTAVEKNSTDIAYAQAKIWIKDGETVTFKNIPYGVTYTVAETKPSDDKYTNKLVFTNGNASTTFNGTALEADTSKSGENGATGDFFGANNAASGSISDASDELTITNNKDNTIDVGVITSNAPYIAMLLVAGVAVVMFIRRRREMIEE